MFRFSILALTLLSFNAFAQNWEINKDHSEVIFKVPYLGVSEISGRFSKFSGLLTVNEENKIQDILVKIDVASIETGNKMRDGHLKGSEFFRSRDFPHIIFKSTSVKEIKPSEYEAIGELTVKDVTKPFTINFTASETVKDTWGYDNKFIKFSSKINRQDFNIKWNKTLDNDKYLVGDEVSFGGVFQTQPIRLKTPSSKYMIPDNKHMRDREKEQRKK